MARYTNLIRLLQQQKEKGNTHIDGSGNFVTADKLEKTLKHEFVKKLNSGEISMDTSCNDYIQERSNLISVDILLAELYNLGIRKGGE